MSDENMKTEDVNTEDVNTEAEEMETEEVTVEEAAVEEDEAKEQEAAEETEEETTEDAPKSRKETRAEKRAAKKKKDPRDEKIEELTDRLQRSMAEFDNYRKRTEKEKASMYVIGAKEIIEKMLPVIDNFERGFAAVPEEQREDPFVDGMDKVYKQLCKTLEDLGVKEIEAMGNEFDPNFHNAVMHVEDEEAGDNTVVEVFQKGYLYKDFVVRHSMVKVAN